MLKFLPVPIYVLHSLVTSPRDCSVVANSTIFSVNICGVARWVWPREISARIREGCHGSCETESLDSRCLRTKISDQSEDLRSLSSSPPQRDPVSLTLTLKAFLREAIFFSPRQKALSSAIQLIQVTGVTSNHETANLETGDSLP